MSPVTATRPVVVRAPAAPARGTDAILVEVLAEVRAVRELLERPPRRRLRDDDDRAVVLAVAAADPTAPGLRFSSSEVLRHARVDDRVREALARADCDTARALGRLFRRVEGHILDGLQLERVGNDRDGIVWRLSRVG